MQSGTFIGALTCPFWKRGCLTWPIFFSRSSGAWRGVRLWSQFCNYAVQFSWYLCGAACLPFVVHAAQVFWYSKAHKRRHSGLVLASLPRTWNTKTIGMSRDHLLFACLQLKHYGLILNTSPDCLINTLWTCQLIASLQSCRVEAAHISGIPSDYRPVTRKLLPLWCFDAPWGVPWYPTRKEMSFRNKGPQTLVYYITTRWMAVFKFTPMTR